MARARGVDLSSVQASVDFPALHAGGYDFVILKGTQGQFGVDPTYAPRIEAARRAGVLVPMHYHVLTVYAPVDRQIKNAVQHAIDYDVDVALDFEVGGTTILQALTFAQGVKAAGRRVVLYSYPLFMRQFQGNASLALLVQAVEGYWSASYPHEKTEPADSEQPWVPSAFGGRWLFWQWSGNGGNPAPGIPQVVDHTLWNGGRDSLVKWMSGNKSEVGRNDEIG